MKRGKLTVEKEMNEIAKFLEAERRRSDVSSVSDAVSYTHLRAHETLRYLVCRLLLEKKKRTSATCTWNVALPEADFPLFFILMMMITISTIHTTMITMTAAAPPTAPPTKAKLDSLSTKVECQLSSGIKC